MARFPQTLRVLRAARDLTQHGLADQAGLTQTRFWQIEHGSGAPLRKTERDNIARVLDVKPSAIDWPRMTPTALQTERARRKVRRDRAIAATLATAHEAKVGMTPVETIVDSTCAAAIARAKAGELLGPHDLMAIWHLKPSRFYELKQRGAFDRFLVDRPIVGRAAYSGVRVYRYVTAEDEQPAFGRKRGVR